MNYVIPANIETPYGELQKTKLWMIQGSPETLVEGLPWYDSTAHLPKYYDGTSVKEFGRVYSAGNGINISNQNIITVKTGNGLSVDANGVININIQTRDIPDLSHIYLSKTLKGANNGVAELDSNGKVPTAQLPSFVDDVIESYVRLGTTELSSTWLSTTDGGSPLTPETGKIYVVLSSGTYQNKTYRWAGSTYVEISASPGAASTTAAGIIEIATQQEVNTGTDNQRAVTPGDLNYYYQRKLVSGTDIKTLNNTSLLGSGNINITEGTVKSADSVAKLYLVGATSQSSSPQESYSSGKVYVQNGYLYLTSLLASTDNSNIAATTSWVKSLNYGTVKSVNGTTPDSNGNIAVSIPRVSDAAITVKVNNFEVGSFTLNSSTGGTINIPVPTNTNELTNGAGFLTLQDFKTINNSSIVGTGNISAVQSYAVDNSALTASGGVAEWTVTHNLGTQDVCVSVIKKSTNEAIFPAWKTYTYNDIKISFLTSEDITAGTYRVVIMGVPNS